MKKALVLLLLFIIACGGPNEETVVQDTTSTSIQDTTSTSIQDTTTTTIPPAPTSDINYIELFNSKLGTELCSDAKEIDITSEECLRQYKENLNYLITLQNEIGDFASDLIAYYETYPELVNQAYEDYINFVENDYSKVFTAADSVEKKYIERFGGVPVINNLTFPNDIWNNCTGEYRVSITENLKKGYIVYENSFSDSILLDVKKSTFNAVEYGGKFYPKQIVLTNYLNEEYSIEVKDNIEIMNIKHWNVLIKNIDAYVKENSLFLTIEYIDGVKKFENLWLNFLRFGLYSSSIDLYVSKDRAMIYGAEVISSQPGVSSYKIDLTKGSYSDISNSSTPFKLRHLMFYSTTASEPPTNRFDIAYINNGDFDNFNYQNLYGCNGESSVSLFIPYYIKEDKFDNYYKNIIDTEFVINR